MKNKPERTQIQAEKAVLSKQKNPTGLLLALFFGCVLVRSVCGALFHEAPTIYIDEDLYTNIAKSLAFGGKLAYRDQPVNYPFILYPLLLVPVYRLHDVIGGDIYRWIQVFQSLLAVSAVFPVYLFARDFTRDNKKALWAAALTAMMPDQMMCGFSMSESLMIPLAMWLLFFGYRLYNERGVKWAVLTAVFTGLMFFTKPGGIVMGVVLLTVDLIRRIRKKEKIATGFSALGIVALSAGAVYGLFYLMRPELFSVMGLYDKQLSEWQSRDVLVSLEASVAGVFLFCAACGGVFAIVPAVFRKAYGEGQRMFVLGTGLGILAILVGTAIFVVPYRWTGELGSLPLHLRYCAMFIPAWIVFTLGLDLKGKKSRALPIILAVFAALMIFPGAGIGFVPGEGTVIDSMALAAFYREEAGISVPGVILTVLTAAFALYLVWDVGKKGWHSAVHTRCSLYFLGFFLLFNTVCGYNAMNDPIDKTLKTDAMEIDAVLRSADEPCLAIIQQDYGDAYSLWLDGRLSRPLKEITNNEAFLKLYDDDGVYQPFVPHDLHPNLLCEATPETTTLILGKTIREHLEVSDTARQEQTGNGHFAVVHITKGEPWIDTMIGGLDLNTLQPGENCYLWLRDPDRNIGGSAVIHMAAKGPGRLEIEGVETMLTHEVAEYTITIPFKKLNTLQAMDNAVQIFGYYTEKAE